MAALQLSNTDRSRRDKARRHARLGVRRRAAQRPQHAPTDGRRLQSADPRIAARRRERRGRFKFRPTAGRTSGRERAKRSAQRAEQAARAQSQSCEPIRRAKLPPEWRDRFAKAQQLNRSLCFLTTWETNFVADLIARGTRWPSPKQAVVILRILEKAGAFSAASADADWEDVP